VTVREVRSDGVLTVLRKATATAGRGDPGRRTFISAVVEIPRRSWILYPQMVRRKRSGMGVPDGAEEATATGWQRRSRTATTISVWQK
jgi:hypothetical protein